jgi:hypothetical protein
MSAQQTAEGAARQAAHSDTLEHLARVGLAAYGLVHLLIAWLAIQLAWFGGGESADQSGALSTLAESPAGKPLLWVLGVGLFALALWQAAEVLRWKSGWSASGKARRTAVFRSVKAVAKAVLYAAIGVLCIRFALGSGGGGSQSEEQTTSGVFGWPGGRWIVGGAALVIIGVGIYHVVKGFTKKFLEQIDLDQCSSRARRLITRLGQVGYPAKGVALGIVGGLLAWAALTYDAEKAAGLDEALHTVREAPLGTWLLTAIALGIAAFGVFALARARYPERA